MEIKTIEGEDQDDALVRDLADALCAFGGDKAERTARFVRVLTPDAKLNCRDREAHGGKQRATRGGK